MHVWFNGDFTGEANAPVSVLLPALCPVATPPAPLHCSPPARPPAYTASLRRGHSPAPYPWLPTPPRHPLAPMPRPSPTAQCQAPDGRSAGSRRREPRVGLWLRHGRDAEEDHREAPAERPEPHAPRPHPPAQLTQAALAVDAPPVGGFDSGRKAALAMPRSAASRGFGCLLCTVTGPQPFCPGGDVTSVAWPVSAVAPPQQLPPSEAA